MKRFAWLAFAHVLLIFAPGPGNAKAIQSSISAPTNFTGAAVSDTSIQWSWNAVLGSSTALGATHYELQEETTNAVIATIPGPGSTPIIFTESGLGPGTYCRHVVAFNGPNSASTADVCVVLSPANQGQISDICPPAVSPGTMPVVVISGAGLSSVTTVFVDGQPVKAVALNDRLLYVILPTLAEGSHAVRLSSTTAPGDGVTILATAMDFEKATDTVRCVENLVAMGSGEGFLKNDGVAAALTSKAQSLEQALRSGNAEAALAQSLALVDLLINGEATTIDTAFAEALTAVLHDSLTGFLFDSSKRRKSIKEVINEGLVGLPPNAPVRLGVADCKKLATQLEGYSLPVGSNTETIGFDRTLAGKKIKVNVRRTADGRTNPPGGLGAGDGADAPLLNFIMEGLDDQVVIVISGKGGPASDDVTPGRSGHNGGKGGDIFVRVRDRDLLVAVGGKGGRGGIGGAGTVGSPNGNDGGAGGAGADVDVLMGTESAVCLHAGDGGPGGNGGPNIQPGNGGQGGTGGKGGRISMSIGSLAADVPSEASPGNGGKGGAGGIAGGDTTGNGGKGGTGGDGGDAVRNSAAAGNVPLKGESTNGSGAGKGGAGGDGGAAFGTGTAGQTGDNGRNGMVTGP